MIVERNTNIIIKVYGVILIIGMLIAFQGSNFPFMKGNDVMTLSGDAFSGDLSRSIMAYNEAPKQTYSVTLLRDALPEIGEDAYNIVIFRLASNGYNVIFNGQYVGGFGDYASGRSNLWNGIYRVIIPRDLIKEVNTLTIENNSLYMTGLTSHPIYITSTEKATRMIMHSNWLNHNMVMISLGVGLLSIVFLFALYGTAIRQHPIYLYLSVAIFFLGVYSIDYSTSEYLMISYVTYKKLIMIAFWAGTFFVSLGLQSMFDRSLPVVVSGIGLAGIIIMAALSPDLIAFKKMYSVWYISQVMTVLSWLVVIIKNIHERIESQVFLSGFGILFIYGIVNMVMDMTGIFFSMNSIVIYLSVFSIMPLLMVYMDFNKNRQELQSEMRLKEAAYEKAIRDALTGAYNKRHLSTVLGERKTNFSIAMFDLDNFKEVNDNYGHQGGDRVLHFIVDMLMNFLRSGDMIFRYGGDEFIVIMECAPEIMRQRMEAFRHFVEHAEINYGMLTIKTTVSVGIYYVDEVMSRQEVLDAVDQALYRAKNNGKNRVCA
ncbi:MAG: GGDEF domain-containing protein [Clostridia bacterium]|nr:GGDEF domain-containing protein [Clostridia bacterium]